MQSFAKELNTIMGRVEAIGKRHPSTTLDEQALHTMRLSLIFCHIYTCPIDFVGLAAAEDFDLIHDVYGVDNHMDRKTKALLRCFVPRYALPAKVAA